VQTTGSRGLHVVVPLDRSLDFDGVRAIVRKLCADLATRHDKLLTIEQRKAKRGNRLFLDTGRNAYGQTAVAPYGVRALDGAPIATPLDWDEALSTGMSSQRYTIGNIFRRLAQKADPWASIGEHPVPASDLENLGA
jgi:bifunctional non-homologous end joining protein LigD